MFSYDWRAFKICCGTSFNHAWCYNFPRTWCAWRISVTHSRFNSFASLVHCPCFQAPLALPLGAPPRAPWNRHTLQPRTAGAWHWPSMRAQQEDRSTDV